MKIKLWLLLLVVLGAQSCSSVRYSAQTKSDVIKDMRILSVRDSSLVVLPGSYSDDITTSMIQQNARVIPLDSVVSLHRFGSIGLFEGIVGAVIAGTVATGIGL